MSSPMELYFSPSGIEQARKKAEEYRKDYPDHSHDLVRITYACAKYYSTNVAYGFLDHLLRDKYSPTRKERKDLQIKMFNCTTVIEPLYQIIKAYGLQLEIVQFLGFRDIRRKTDKERPPEREHFALVVKIEKDGAVKEYLTDPFSQVYGEIVEKKERSWKIKGYGKYNPVKREFQTVLYYTQEEYAQLLYDLRDDGKSLDMLVAGQQVTKELVLTDLKCTQMLYYDDTAAALTTLVYIPQIGITDKAIQCAHYFDADGTPQKEELTFSLAENRTWHHLIGERRIAVLNYGILQEIAHLFEDGFEEGICFEKQPRIGELLNTERMSTKKKTLLEIAERLYAQLLCEQQTALKPLICARTLYEAQAKGQEYVYDEEKRDQRIKDILQEYISYRDQIRTLNDIIWNADWNFSNTSKKDLRKAKRMKQIVKEKRDNLNFLDLNLIRKQNKPMYHRNMDKVLFAQLYEQTTPEELTHLVEEQGLDWRVGYLAMITDFIPYAFGAKKDLELDLFMPSLQRRVKARRAPFAREHEYTSWSGMLKSAVSSFRLWLMQL